MDKQTYHKPELRTYGNISVMTQSMGSGAMADNPGKDATKTS